MKIRRLQIESLQMARISIEAQMAGLSIHAPMRRIETVQQQRAQMKVSREYPSLKVDMESLRDNIGLKSIRTLTREFASRSYEKAKQAIKNIENNGDYAAKQPRTGNPIAEISRMVMLRTETPSTSGRAVDPTVQVEANPGSFDIDWSIHDLSIKWDDYQTPIITVEPKHSLDITLAQKAHVKFKVVEYTYPPESGRTVDAEI